MSESNKVYRIGGMDCANCAKDVETGVSKLDGVQSVSVDYASGKMTLEGDISAAILRERVEALGKTIEDEETTRDADTGPQHGGIVGFAEYLLKGAETRLALIGGGLTVVTLALTLLGLPYNIAGILYTLAMMVAVYPIARSGLNTLVINHTFNINLLMSIAAIGAVLLGEYLEAAIVIFLYTIGEAMEGYATDRARGSIKGLLELKPAQAVRVNGDLTETVPVESLAVDDQVLVKPGERVPADGEVVSGDSSIDESTITGESVPAAKTTGGDVFAGTLNGDGALYVRVTRTARDDTLSRIIALVEEAQAARAPSQRIIDRFANVYTPVVVGTALLVAIVPPLFFGAPFLNTADTHGWLYRALTMLVIACPCALVISTPVTVISAITAAARRGILVKGGAYLEALAQVDTLAFDKTGTLTRGQPVVTDYYAAACGTHHDDCPACNGVLATAAAVEGASTHPLARAITNAADTAGLRYETAQDVQVLAGQGVTGTVNAQGVTLGSHALFDERFPHPKALCESAAKAEAGGHTTMMLHDGAMVSGIITAMDAPRDASRETVSALEKMGLRTVMLTGDNQVVAQAVAAQIGVDDVRAGLLPQDKVEAVKGLREEGHKLAMVGDGVNDAPALATADVGVAMGGAGSAAALQTADVALMSDDIAGLPEIVRLARFARRLIRENIALAFAVKLGFLLLAAFGMATMWMAVFADVGMALLVTLNGMRPLRRTTASR